MNTNKMEVAVIGVGYWGPNLVRNLLGVAAVGKITVCDNDKDKLKIINTRYPNTDTVDSFDKVLENKNIIAVLIATPVSTHFNLAKKALEAGKNVFIEKPMAATSEEGIKLIKMAKEGNLKLMVGHTFMYSPPVLKIKSIIDEKALGKIFYISSSRVNLGLHQKDVSVIWDLAPHDFSILFYWLGEKPITISVLGEAFVQKGIPDVAFINMGFKSGCIAHINVSWLSPSKLRRTTIVGDRKMLVYDDTESLEKVKIFDKGVDYKNPSTFGEYQLSYRAGDIVSPQLENFEPLGKEMEHFIDCILNDTDPLTDGERGLEVVEALEAAEKSMIDGGSVVKL